MTMTITRNTRAGGFAAAARARHFSTARDDAANDARDGGRNALNYVAMVALASGRAIGGASKRRGEATATDGDAALEQRGRARIGRTSYRWWRTR